MDKRLVVSVVGLTEGVGASFFAQNLAVTMGIILRSSNNIELENLPVTYFESKCHQVRRPYNYLGFGKGSGSRRFIDYFEKEGSGRPNLKDGVNWVVRSSTFEGRKTLEVFDDLPGGIVIVDDPNLNSKEALSSKVTIFIADLDPGRIEDQKSKTEILKGKYKSQGIWVGNKRTDSSHVGTIERELGMNFDYIFPSIPMEKLHHAAYLGITLSGQEARGQNIPRLDGESAKTMSKIANYILKCFL